MYSSFLLEWINFLVYCAQSSIKTLWICWRGLVGWKRGEVYKLQEISCNPFQENISLSFKFPPINHITTKLKRILIKTLWNFYSELYCWLHFEYHLLDLLVLDIWGLNGWAVINHVKEIDPWMQCLIRCKAAWAWSSAFPTFSSISSFHWWFFWLVYASFNRNLLTWLKWVGFEKWM